MEQQQVQQQMTPEQIEALQEKLKNMSPEELMEFQKKQCIFCQIVAGKIKTRKIYDDDKCIAVLDINPASLGHILLLPKEHYSVMPQLPQDELTHIFIVTKHLSNAILRALDARGTNIIVANGPAAGQKAQHFMIHIIPRRENDGIQFTLPQRKLSEDDIKTISKKLSEKMIELLGKKEIKKEKPEKKGSEIKKKEKPVKKKPKMSETQGVLRSKASGTTKVVSEHAQKSSKKISDKQKKGTKKEKSKTKKQQKTETDLDDIARILGVK